MYASLGSPPFEVSYRVKVKEAVTWLPTSRHQSCVSVVANLDANLVGGLVERGWGELAEFLARSPSLLFCYFVVVVL